MDHSLLLDNAKIIDGTGTPWFSGAIGIDDGTIREIYRGTHDVSGETRIDVDGKVVAPGFIDTHSHSDLYLFTDPTLEPKTRQGITTEILGQDGFSMAPMYRPDGAEQWEDHLSGLDGRTPDPWQWGSTAEYFEAIQENGIGPNVGMLVGHGTVRFNVLGMTDSDPTPSQLAEMTDLVTESLDAGALGVSTGLVYTPQYHAGTDEVQAVAAALSAYQRPFVAHIRSERFDLWNAFDEFMDIGATESIPLHHSHFKVIGPPQYGKADRALSLIEYARDRGIDYTGDQYPYRAGSTMLSAVLPPWVMAGTPEDTIDRLRDPDVRDRIEQDIEEWRLDDWHNPGKYIGWDSVVIASVGSGDNTSVVGKSVEDVAAETDRSPVVAVCELLVEEELQVAMTLHQLREDDVRRIMQDPRICIGTDGIFGEGKPHPRLYGTYPKVLETYVREENLLTIEDAIRKMTSLPARIFGLHRKGIIRPGMDADLVVFDPQLVSTSATYDEPRRYPTGLFHVIVNGEFVVRNETTTGNLPGEVIRV